MYFKYIQKLRVINQTYEIFRGVVLQLNNNFNFPFQIDCLAVYDNDNIAVDDPDETNTAINMYETLLSEGHDARLLRFSPSDDETIPGGHTDPKNNAFWHVGCLGITAQCSEVLITS